MIAVVTDKAAVNVRTTPVEVGFAEQRKPGGCGVRQRVGDPERQQSAECRGHRRERERSGRELPHDAATAGAERDANRDLLLPAGATRQQEVGDVDARNQQDERDGADERQQQWANRARQLFAERLRDSPECQDPRLIGRQVADDLLRNHVHVGVAWATVTPGFMRAMPL